LRQLELDVTSDVLIVGHREDAVARRLDAALAARGHSAAWFDGPAAARLFTIRVTAAGNQVAPDMPMFVRPLPWWDVQAEATPDGRFLRNECYAAFWAAAALSCRPVINRPTPEGTAYRVTAGSLQTEAGGRGEIHASGPEQIAEDDGAFWGENAEYRVSTLATLPVGVPVRARRVDLEAGYEIVTVVGAQSFLATTDPRSAAHDLATRSIRLARQFGVHFGAVTWAITDDAAEAVRLNPNPGENELRYRWADVLDALCRDLLA
jgi:hypothetical protein